MVRYRVAVPVVVPILSAVLAFETADAQRGAAAASPGATTGRALCWRPRSAPRCRAYLVTEFGYERAAISSRPGGFQRNPDFGSHIVWSIGPMVNRGPSAAWGGVLSAGIDETHSDGGGVLRAEARYRRWLRPTRGVDVSAGVSHKLVRTSSGEPVRANGLTAAVSADQGFLGLVGRVDVLYGGGRSRTAALLGIRTGSYLTPIATLAAALVAITSIPAD